jgi:hypothetical protein
MDMAVGIITAEGTMFETLVLQEVVPELPECPEPIQIKAF